MPAVQRRHFCSLNIAGLLPARLSPDEYALGIILSMQIDLDLSRTRSFAVEGG
jgi:hypothetical protein